MHNNECLRNARESLDRASTTAAMAALITDAVARNETWRAHQCINLVAAESPTSLSVRTLLASEVGIRASGGHIGRDNRFFSGMAVIDEIEALCVELLKKTFRCKYADHRLMGGMAGVMAAYTALAQPGDLIMSAPIAHGGDSSHRRNGPAGARGLHIIDIPFDEDGQVDLKGFKQLATQYKPKVVGMGMAVTLFPLPVAEMKELIYPWGGKFYYDAAHQLGLIAAGLFQDPLNEGADLMTGSSGKTFSGPQGGLILWNDPRLSSALYEVLFPTLTGSHQINRVAALAVGATEILEFGRPYMNQVIKNAQALAAALDDLGVHVLFKKKNFTQSHQIVIQPGASGGAEYAVRELERAGIICNKVPLATDNVSLPNTESGIRFGTTEVTRLGMKTQEMAWIARSIADVLFHRRDGIVIANEVRDFMKNYRTLYYCHANGGPHV